MPSSVRSYHVQGDWLVTASIFGSFIWCFRIFNDFVFGHYEADYYIHKTFTWFDLSYLNEAHKFEMGVYIDNMTAIMLLMVSGVGFLIHLFSTFYMKGDVRYGKFFTLMALFTTGMLGLVLSDNLLMIFCFWEIMGFCSYSLIGFYYEKEAAGNASMKAFMTTRIGDVCFLLGILAIWSVVGSVTLVDIYAAIASGSFEGQTVMGISLASFAAFCLFGGTIGKSAQFPLQVWLPDAMMGPTPCSALIHAATMVAGGVYLSLRLYPLMVLGEMTTFIAFIGAITAFGAATIALVQTDLKAVLAYSTISQLGYMVMGIGVGAYNPAFMHLITHAVFKACLFLAAGSVIHSLHDHHTHAHVQEMPRMGGLRKKLPFTFLAMLCCSLAISGVPIFSGFVSKDRILGDALYWGVTHGNKLAMIVPILGFTAAFLTAFYMFRMMFLTFFGKPRDEQVYKDCHTEKLQINRNVPLLILTVFTLGVFFSGSLTGQGKIPLFPKAAKEWFKVLVTEPNVETFTQRKREKITFSGGAAPLATTPSTYDPDFVPEGVDGHLLHTIHVYGAIASLFIAIGGIFLSFSMYLKRSLSPNWWVNTLGFWHKALLNKYYFDDFYIGVVIKKGLLNLNLLLARFDLNIYDKYVIDGQEKVVRVLYKIHGWVDMKVVDALVDFTGVVTRFFNVVLRTFQSGKVQFYIVILLIVLSSYIWSLNTI